MKKMEIEALAQVVREINVHGREIFNLIFDGTRSIDLCELIDRIFKKYGGPAAGVREMILVTALIEASDLVADIQDGAELQRTTVH